MAERGPRAPASLLVTRNFPPLVGGMEKVNQHLLASLAELGPVALSGPEGATAHANAGALVAESPLKPLPRFLLGCAWRGWSLARLLKPTLVMAGSGLAAPIAWTLAWWTGARSAVYLHGLDIIAPSAAYQSLWLPFIRRFDIVFANSANTRRLAIEAGVPAGRISILHPGTGVPALDAAAGEAFRHERGFGRQPLLLSVGRLTRRKGLAEFVAGALPAIVAARPDTLLIVIGGEAADALHGASGNEQARIEATARASGVGDSLRFLGRCDEATLFAAYQAADCHVFAVLDTPGDVEGFGMVALESAAHGLPTVAFAVGGIPDAVDTARSGALLSAGDYAGFAREVLRFLQPGAREGFAQASRAFAADLQWSRFGERLRARVSAP
jgi:phosphatidylinositol alpha-1,6-mannosyltransferase